MVAFALGLAVALAAIASEGAPTTEQRVADLVDNVRNNRIVDTMVINEAPPEELLPLLKKYLKARDFRTRFSALAWVGSVLHRAHDAPTRESAISLLLNVAETDHEGGIDDRAAELLGTLPAKAFDAEARRRVGELLSREQPRRNLILLAGVIGNSAFETRLRTLASRYKEGGPPMYGSSDWPAQLALARMGDAPSIERVVKGIEGVNDLSVLTRWLPNLGYTRQPEAVDLLKKYLFSDALLRPTTPRGPGQPIAGYALYELAKMLYDFPVKVKESKGYSKREIAEARAWMNANPKPTILR